MTGPKASNAVAVAVALLCLAGSAFAQTPAGTQATPGRKETISTPAEQNEARERYARAMQLFSEGRYDLALIEMQRAYSLNPSYRILYNLAQIQSHLGDAAAALENYEKYLAGGGAEVPPPRAAEVNQEIAKLRPRVGSVELVVKQGGAEVLVDDVVVGRSPFRKTILVNAGQHKFSAAKTGTPPTARVVSIASMDTLTLELELVSLSASTGNGNVDRTVARPTTADVGAPPPTHETTIGTPRSTPWGVWVAAGVLASSTVTAAVLTQLSVDKLDELRDRPGASRQELDNQAAAAHRGAIITDVLLGSTVVTAAIGLYYTLNRRSQSEAAQAASRLPVIAVPNGVVVRGAF